MILKKIIFYFLALFLLTINPVNGQSVTTIEFPNCGVPLDIVSLKKDQIHLISSQGIFQYKNNGFFRIESFDTLNLRPSSQSFHNFEKQFFFNSSGGGFDKIDLFQSKNSLAKTTKNYQSGMVLYGDKYIWVAEEDIFRNDAEKWETFHETEKNHNSYWDGRKSEADIWFCNFGNGVFKISDEENIINFTKEDGLFDNYCTSISIDGETVNVGHNGAVSTIQNGRFQIRDLRKQIGKRPIIEMENRSTGDHLLLTPDKLFCESEKTIESYGITLKPGEEFISVHEDQMGSIWVLSNLKIYRISHSPFMAYDFADIETDYSYLYRIRDNVYYSNKARVYGYVPDQERWEIHKRKVAPSTASRTAEGHTILGFANQQAIKIDKTNARILRRFEFPEDEQINNIIESETGYFICTNSHLYHKKEGGEIELISINPTSFYNVIDAFDNSYVFSEKAIYKLQNDSLSRVSLANLNGNFPYSTNQFVSGGKIYCCTNDEIKIINPETDEVTSVPFQSLEIKDIHRDGDNLYLLSDKSLLRLDVKSLNETEPEVLASVPLPHQLLESKIYDFGTDELWIKGLQRVLKINKNSINNHQKPILTLDRIITKDGYTVEVGEEMSFVFQQHDLPLKLEFFNNNYWSNNTGYVYHLAGDNNNSSEWQSGNHYEFNPEKGGVYMLNAKMRDEVFGQDIFSETIQIHVLKPDSLSRKSLIIIPLFLFFAMILGYFVSKSN